MDRGIINNLKSHYRRYFVQHCLLKATEAGKTPLWTVLDEIYSIKAAWTQVTTTTSNCFRYCGFITTDADPEEEDEEDDISLAQLMNNLWAAGMDFTTYHPRGGGV